LQIALEINDEQLRKAGYPTHDKEGRRISYQAPTEMFVSANKEDGRSVLHLLAHHDPDSFIHGWYHRFYKKFTKGEKAAYQRYHNESGNTQDIEEHFADEGRDEFFQKRLHEKAGVRHPQKAQQ